MSVITQPTRGDRYLNRVYVSDLHYSNLKVVKSAVKSDHMAIVAWSVQDKKTVSKTRSKRMFRKHMAREHARFLASVSTLVYSVCYSSDAQDEFDKFYSVLTRLLDTYYPERSVTVTLQIRRTSPPQSSTCCGRKIMWSGRIEKAAALTAKIGVAIKNCSAELSRPDVLSNATGMWKKVRQLTGRTKHTESNSASICADTLNDHYAAVSTDVNYTAPSVKHTVCNRDVFSHISEWRIFNILDKLRPASTGPDGIPAWFLRIGTPLFAAPLSSILNLSLVTSVVPRQWKQACILPIAKIAAPRTSADYRPISITSVISKILETHCRKGIYISITIHYTTLPPQFNFQRPVCLPTNRINHSGNCSFYSHCHCRP